MTTKRVVEQEASLHNSHFDRLRKSRFCLTRQEELDMHLDRPELIIDPYRFSASYP